MFSSTYQSLKHVQKIQLLAVAFLLFTLSPLVHQQTFDSESFNLGKVTINPRKQHAYTEPMADYIAGQMGLNQGQSVFTKAIPDMIEKFRLGKVDLFTGSAWEAAALIQSGYSEPMAIKHKNGSPFYHSLIVARKDSGIRALSDLQGKLFAFEDRGSTSAYRIPAMEMMKAGLTLKESKDFPETATVHYRFSSSEQNSSAWLFLGKVDAIALSDNDWKKADNVPEFQRELFEIIYKSEPIPRAMEVVRANLDNETKAKLRELLLNLNTEGAESEVMGLYHQTTNFSEIDQSTLGYLPELANFYSY